jgi:hypothetical protein
MAMASTESSPVKRFFAARVFPWGVVLFGALAIWVGLDDFMRARSSAEWPSVDGAITRSTIERVTSGGGSSNLRSVTYAARIAYEYAVEGTRHTGQRISYGHVDTEAQSDADKVVKLYAVGRQLKVHYMPDNPGASVLEPGARGLPWFYLALGIVFVLVGLVLAAIVPRLLTRAY